MIYLMRHGLDDERYIGGWSSNDLTLIGQGQVIKSAHFIKDSKFDIKRIYSSDIKRAIITSKIISDILDIPIEFTPALRELNKGLLNGMKVEDALFKFPQCSRDIGINFKYPEGEAMVDLYNRVSVLLKELEHQDHILLVTHRGVINMIYFILNGIKLNMDKTQFGVTHASIHELDIEGKVIRKVY